MAERSSPVTKSDLQATYNDLLALQDQTDHVPLTIALDAVGAALRSLDEAARAQEPAAYLHTLHMNLGQTHRKLMWTEPCPFGTLGKDYSEEYTVSCAPLYLNVAQPVGQNGEPLTQLEVNRLLERVKFQAEMIESREPERLSVEQLARHFGVSVEQAKAAQSDFGFMYRIPAAPQAARTSMNVDELVAAIYNADDLYLSPAQARRAAETAVRFIDPAQAATQQEPNLPFHQETMAGLDSLTIRVPIASQEPESAKEALHYLGAIKVRLELLYEHSTQDSRLLEHLSDEVDWIDAEIERLRTPDVAQPPADPYREGLGYVSLKIAEKIAQLRIYRDTGCQLDHARTIAEGRISQAEMDLRWVHEALAMSSTEGK